MKKILIIFTFLLTMPVFATSMCVEDDTVAVVLDASTAFTGSSNNSSAGSWSATGPYGTIRGVVARVSQNYGETVNEITDNGALITGGENNGRYCYARILHPVVSAWVMANSNSSNISGCLASYLTQLKSGTSSTARETIFRSIKLYE